MTHLKTGNHQCYDIQIKQRVHLPMKLCDQEGIWKTQLYTDSLSPKIKPPYNNLQNIT